jgi:hypothetical protein
LADDVKYSSQCLIADNLMLTRTAGLVAHYIARNYREAVGGPTGANEQLVDHTTK